MFLRNSPMGTTYNSLGIGNNPVYPWKKLPRRFGISQDNFIMRQVRSFYHFSIGSPTISADGLQKILGFFCRRSVAKSFQEAFHSSGRGIINHLHMCKTRLLFSSPIAIKRYSAQHRTLPLTPAAFPVTFWTKKRIIHFYQAGKTVSSISIRHRLANLMGHQPRRLIISDSQDTLHLGYRHAHLVHSHVVDKPIPFDQRRASLVEYRPRRQTYFCPARFAIQNISRPDKPSFNMSAPGAFETIRPSHFAKVLGTSFFSGKFFLKFEQAALPVSLGHLRTPSKLRVHYLYELSQ